MTRFSHIILAFLFATLWCNWASAQCHVNSININTGYNPATGLALPIGTASSPSLDPRWIVVNATSSIPGAASPGSPAYIVPSITGAWVTNPTTNPGRWISVLNSNTYPTDGAGTAYNMTLGRPFRTCTDDSIKLTLYIANDNWISVVDVDGTHTLGFSQTSSVSGAFSSFWAYTQTIYLTAGTHILNVLVNNLNMSYYLATNPTGLDLYGTIASSTGLPSLVYEVDTNCNSFVCAEPVCNTVSLQDSVTLCSDSTVHLTASLAGPDSVIKIRWSPPAGLSDSTIFNPILTAGAGSGYYHITVTSLIPGNLITNGSFEFGNSAFSSGYTYTPTSTSPGRYAIGTNPITYNSAWASMGDHTTGSGNMLIVDATTASGVSFWCQTIPVTPNSYYDFSAWAANLYVTSPPNLVFTINGVTLGSTFTPTAVGTWLQFLNTWYSGSATYATICITDANTASFGNDFVIDDISLTKRCIATDSIYVTVKPNPVVRLGNDTSICAGNTVTLQSSILYSAPTYLWNTGSTLSSITTGTAGQYWLRVDLNGCVARDTMILRVKPNPIVNLGNDTGLCSGTAITANIAPVGGLTYLWSTGATTRSIPIAATGSYWITIDSNGCKSADTINVTIFPDFVVNLGPDASYCQSAPIVLTSSATYGSSAIYLWSNGDTTSSISITTTGTYWLRVTQGSCTRSDTVHITITPDYGVHLGPDTLYCRPGAVQLQSSDTYTGATYLWSTGATTDTTSVTASGSYWLRVFENGCVRADTINIRIVYDTLIIWTNDTAICKGQHVQVLASSYAFGATYTYQWIPTAGVPVSTILNPLMYPDTSAMYVLQATTADCPPVQDSLYIDVQPNPMVYLGGNRQICQFDTLHLVPYVVPGWYANYAFNWSPATFLDHSNTRNVVFTVGDTTKILLTVTTPAGCIGTDSAMIITHPGNFAVAAPDVFICPHDSVQLIVTAPAGSAFHWSPSYYINDSTSGAPWAKRIADVNYAIIATSEFGCRDTVHLQVTVFPSAVIMLDDSVTIYPGESYQVRNLTNCTSFSWFPPTGLSNPAESSPVITPEISTKYIVYGTTVNGCKTSDSIIVRSDPESLLAIPNAFTPGTGANNTLKIIRRGAATLNYFRVFDRWGVMVFEATNIDAGWDGSFKGAPQPFGVYVYDVQAVTNAGTLFNKHGNVTLIR